MSEPSPARRGYHHGHLKDALLDAARDLVAAGGPAGVTLAEASRRAGVSPSAPYRHFKDRDALMAALAERGFALFADQLAGAFGGGAPDPTAAFMRVGDAYLDFARREPGLYGAMFTACPPGGKPATPSGGRAFDLLVAAARDAGGGPDLPQESILAIWALAHGAATLAASGHLEAAEARAALHAGVLAILTGAGAG
ncbi:TetR/AcrR family transcriptional regulator [Azorhizobium doebereinerae]|uniref:TetR/AcrR family transcriptional regulator n=1 Tax=Azorhizobium doebereinerae TaxID=281091 RepID=UPI00040D1FB9|nr:TetR/AcrR family transcriptional regulator [Azorhizobium doebereinerae]